MLRAFLGRSLVLGLALLLSSALTAQLEWVADHPATIKYHLDLQKVQQHELRITIDFPAVGPGVFYVSMPQSSPGRYAVHNFAKNVYDLEAFDAAGQPLKVHRDGIARWAIADHGGAVKLSYTLFANGGDGTYSGIDDRKIHLNMPASFIYGEGLNDRPVTSSWLRASAPTGRSPPNSWTSATVSLPRRIITTSTIRPPLPATSCAVNGR
jgi:predicted metalloprotease with PDZ domain